MRFLLTRLSFLILITTLLLAEPLLAETDCESCKRAGRFEECTVDDPMFRDTDVTEPGEDIWENAHLPGGGPASRQRAVCASMEAYMRQLFQPDCFGILGRGNVEAIRETAEELDWPEADIPENYTQPEYSFDVDFVSGLEKQPRERDDRPIVSRLKVSMYFEGDERELVHEWEGKGTLNPDSGESSGFSVVQGRLGKAYKEGPSITEIIDEFEKRPDDCEMELEEDVVKLGQVVEIELSDFKDVKGETSREFNRVMLEVLHGKILNGMPSKHSADHRVFPIGEGPIKIRYEAPDNCDTSSDSLKINSSCEILDEEREPYADTELEEEIQSKEIPLFCPGVYAIMTSTHKKSTNWDKGKRGMIDRMDWDQTTSLTVRVDFDKEPAQVRQSFDMTTMSSAPDRYRYEPVKWTINSPQHSGNGNSLTKKNGPRGLDYMLERSSSETGIFKNLSPKQSKLMLTIDVDPATGKAKQVSVPAYEADLFMTTTQKCTKKERRTVDGREILETEDCSDTSKHESKFLVGYGEDECWEISGGNGISSITGECQRRIDRDNGYEEFAFRWSITIQTE